MTKSSLRRWIALLALACVLLVSAGCGQKGDLYLPDRSARKADYAGVLATGDAGTAHA